MYFKTLVTTSPWDKAARKHPTQTDTRTSPPFRWGHSPLFISCLSMLRLTGAPVPIYRASRGRKRPFRCGSTACAACWCVFVLRHTAEARMCCMSYASSPCGGWGKTDRFVAFRFKLKQARWQEQQQPLQQNPKIKKNSNSEGWKMSWV